MKIATKEVQRQYSTSGEVESLVWKNVVFKWARHRNGFDEYDVEGLFVGLKPGFAYQNLSIVVDSNKNCFKLFLGQRHKITKIDLLGI